MIINPIDFHSKYQVNYYNYKQLSLRFLLENIKMTTLNEIIENYSDKDYIRAIKSDIRQTYFHSIETVFDLIFALRPDENGLYDEKNILVTISKSKFHYDAIKQIAENPDALTFLNKKIVWNKRNIPLLGCAS